MKEIKITHRAFGIIVLLITIPIGYHWVYRHWFNDQLMLELLLPLLAIQITGILFIAKMIMLKK